MKGNNVRTLRRQRVIAIVAVAMAHFALSNLILPIVEAVVAEAAGTPGGTGMAVTLLVRATRLLHFPLVTLALFPREWFPGHWVYVPMALNSLIWAFVILGVAALYRKSARHSKTVL